MRYDDEFSGLKFIYLGKNLSPEIETWHEPFYDEGQLNEGQLGISDFLEFCLNSLNVSLYSRTCVV